MRKKNLNAANESTVNAITGSTTVEKVTNIKKIGGEKMNTNKSNAAGTGSTQNMKLKHDLQSRKWLLTINNPLPEFSHEKIKQTASLSFPTFEYLAMADEIGEQKTTHVHVFLSFTSAVRFSTVKKHFPTAHIDAVKGSVQDNIDYIRKQGKWAGTAKAETSVPDTFEELGTRPPENKGKSWEMQELYRMIVAEGLSNAEIIRTNNDYILNIDKLDKVRTTFLQDTYRSTRRLDLEVVYVFGVTGSGKSRGILDEHGDANCCRVTDYDHPFDAYTTERVLVFEEFRDSLPLKDMLNYLDIYPIQLPARYANKYACYNRVYICTNWPLEKQYGYEQRHDEESYKAFLRRVHRVIEYTENGTKEYGSVQAYFDRDNSFQLVGAHGQGQIPFEEQGADV